MPSAWYTRRSALRAGGAAAAAALAGCSSSCPDGSSPTPATVVDAGDDPTGETLDANGPAWPTLRGDAANRGFREGAAGPGEGAALRWRTSVAAGPARPSAPALVGATAYVVDGGGTLRALATADGGEQWAAPAVGGAESVTVAGGRAFAASEGGVVAVTADDGRVAWRDGGYAAAASPVASGGDVFVPGEDRLRAYDAETGEVRWEAEFDGPATRAAVAPRAELVFSVGGRLRALSTADGTEAWSASVGSVEHFPVVADGTVFVGGYDGLAARTVAEGDRLWTFERGGGRAFEAPVVASDAYYSMESPGEGPGSLFALERADGGESRPSPEWCSWLGEGDVWAATPERVYATMPVRDDRAEGDEAVQAFRRDTGEATLQFRADRTVRPPAVTRNAAVFVTAGGAVCGVGGG